MRNTVILLISILSIVSRGGALDHWVRRNPLPFGGFIRDIVEHEDHLVAIGQDGKIWRSTNIFDWTEEQLPEVSLLQVFSANHELYLQAGFPPKPGHNSGSALVRYESSGSVAQVMADTYTPSLCYGNGVYLLVSSDRLQRSTNGSVWEPVPGGVGIHKVLFSGGNFFRVSDHDVASSPDGLAWTVRTDQGGQFLSADDGIVVVVKKDLAQFSTNGIEWASIPVKTPGVIWGVSVGRQGAIIYGYDQLTERHPQCVWTTNFTNWETSSPEFGDPGYTIIHHRDKFVAAGASVLAVSDNLQDWTDIIHGPKCDFHDLAFGNGRYVAVGYSSTDRNIAWSDDGIDWHETIGVTNGLMKVVFAMNQFVAVGSFKNILRSLDGKTWEAQKIGDGSYFDLLVHNQEFLALGGLRLARSRDGINWQIAPVPWWFDRLASNGKTCVFAGPDGAKATEDIEKWTYIQTGGFATDVVYGQGHFLMSTGSNLLKSMDGFVWSIEPSPENGELSVVGDRIFLSGSTVLYDWMPDLGWRPIGQSRKGLVYANGNLFSLGQYGEILQATDFLALRHVSGDGLNVQILADPHAPVTLQTSSNLIDWYDFKAPNAISPGEPIKLPTDSDRKFFRVQQVEASGTGIGLNQVDP